MMLLAERIEIHRYLWGPQLRDIPKRMGRRVGDGIIRLAKNLILLF